METARLSSKFQLSIPEAVRRTHNWQVGQTFAFLSKGAGVLLVPVPDADDLKGFLRGADPTSPRDRSDRT